MARRIYAPTHKNHCPCTAGPRHGTYPHVLCCSVDQQACAWCSSWMMVSAWTHCTCCDFGVKKTHSKRCCLQLHVDGQPRRLLRSKGMTATRQNRDSAKPSATMQTFAIGMRRRGRSASLSKTRCREVRELEYIPQVIEWTPFILIKSSKTGTRWQSL